MPRPQQDSGTESGRQSVRQLGTAGEPRDLLRLIRRFSFGDTRLEQQLQSELNLPRSPRRTGDYACGRSRSGRSRGEHHGIGAAEIGTVQDVEKFCPKL